MSQTDRMRVAWGQFLLTGLSLCAVCLSPLPVQGNQEGWKPTGKETPASMKARASAINRPKEIGRYYQATVPDTLDLSERAWLGINHFTEIISEERDYEMPWGGFFGPTDITPGWPGFTYFWISPLMACQPKAIEAMVMERLMSGSQQNLEREAKMLEMMASHVGEDGIFWVPKYSDKPWLGPVENLPYANVHGQGRMMRAMVAWYQYTGNPRWKELVDRMVDGMDRLMTTHKGDYAYFPTQGWIPDEYFRSCYIKDRGWKDTSEPENEKGGEEGSLFNHQGHIPGVLANWYVLTGNKQALKLSGELVQFLTKPKFWADWKGGEYPGVVGAEHGHWDGHLHGHVNTLRAILEYAVATNDARLKQFVRDGYEWGRQHLLPRIGLVGDGQGCGCGRLIGIAVKLSDAGIGDYWEDVDLYIRNQGSEMQFTPEDIPHMRELVAKHPDPDPPQWYKDHTVGTNVRVVESAVGAFSMGYPPNKRNWALCCSPHGNMGLFYAWDATLRYSNGVARVNLLLNRASPWMDVDNYIPYEGKVVLRNKLAKEALVRMPLYVDLKTVTCQIAGKSVRPQWFGRYLRIRNLKAGDAVVIQFPIEERIEKWTSPAPWYGIPKFPVKENVVFAFKFKGNTLIEVSPPLWDGTWLYEARAEKYRTSRAPMKQVRRYVTPATLKW